MSRKDLFREGQRRGHVAESERWFAYHGARNESTHTYNEARAVAVFEEARRFLPDAQELLAVLVERND